MNHNRSKFLSLLLAALLAALSCMPAFAAAPNFSTQNYNPDHVARIADFLNQTDANGIVNGMKLNPNGYSPDDPSTWRGNLGVISFNEAGDLVDIFVINGSIYPQDNGLAGSLDVSGITTLHGLFLYNGTLDQLNITGCTGLTEIEVARNCLTSIEGFNTCTNLQTISVGENSISELDVTNATNATELWCGINNISVLDLTNCVSLTKLGCSSNPISEIDLSNCPNLISADCCDMNLSEFDVCGLNLQYLYCSGNNISSIDFSSCTDLLIADFTNNPMTSMDFNPVWHGAPVHVECSGDGYATALIKDTLDETGNWTFPVTLYANTRLGSSFLYWEDIDTGEIISTGSQLNLPRFTNANYRAVFRSTTEETEHLVFFVDRDGTMLSRQSVAHGGSAVLPEEPSLEYYTFTGWAGGDYTNVTCDMVLVAQYNLDMILGDVNYNGFVEVSDAVLSLRAAMGLISLSDEQYLAADFDESHSLNVADSVLILRAALQLI